MSGIPKKIQIAVPETYKKVSEEVWQELEEYLYTGFLTATSVIQGKPFTFKTVNHHELQMIRYLRPVREAVDGRDTFRYQFIAHSILTVDGRSMLYERPRHIDDLAMVISHLPGLLQNKIIENLAALNERSARLYPLVEVYTYENRSRFRWMHVKGCPVHSSVNTGIPGTDELGMNACQQTWTALNQLIDRRESMERDWSHAKFIGSCFAGKAIRSIDERDRSRLEKERVDREELKIKVLHQYLNRTSEAEEPEELAALPDGRRVSVVRKFKAETAEDLATELSSALSGEKDYHDMVIEQQQRKMKEQAELMERQRMKMYALPSSVIGRQTSSSMILGSRADAEAYLKRVEEARNAVRTRIASGFGDREAEEASDD